MPGKCDYCGRESDHSPCDRADCGGAPGLNPVKLHGTYRVQVDFVAAIRALGPNVTISALTLDFYPNEAPGRTKVAGDLIRARLRRAARRGWVEWEPGSGSREGYANVTALGLEILRKNGF